LERWYGSNDELRVAIAAPNSPDESQGYTYWFRCPKCNFDWLSGFKYSIVFVSICCITDDCPNCRKRHVPAFRVE
jgi:hypothetical protein